MDLNDVSEFVVMYFCLVFSLSVHEASHALTAERCGDPTARLLGRVTLNPIKHIDPIGTVLMPMLMFFTGLPYLFGWAKPVPYNPRNLKNFQRDPVLIALAGPFSNLIITVVFIFLMRVFLTAVVGMEGLQENYAVEILWQLGKMMISINLLLMLFNLIPVPPLDGSALLSYVLPESGKQMLDSIGPFGILIAIFISSRLLSGPLNYLMEKAFLLVTYGFVPS
ncbi:MAG: site-2 protease family protein [Candidatus Hydrogenedentes bacterium]|nr:site-2 protease family protein [Candidatus Hydrogenedentota bacterium]